METSWLELCAKCHKLKPIEEFSCDSYSTTKHRHECQECERQYREKNSEARALYTRQWRLKHYEKAVEAVRRYRATHIEQIRQQVKAYKERNHEWLLERSRESYRIHAAERIEKAQEYHRKYPERAYAKKVLANAVLRGYIKRNPICVLCKKIKHTQAHHENYLDPLRVHWLCGSCHQKLHIAIKKSPPTKLLYKSTYYS